MKLLVLGSGGREHAISWKLAPEVSSLHVAPGNAGTAVLARNAAIDPTDADAVLAYVEKNAIDLTVVGPELPLTRGIAERFMEAGRPIVGPTSRAAVIESSKAFAKEFFARHRVPTARHRLAGSPAEAMAILDRGEFGYPVVVKADGLAAGKGVVVAEDRERACEAVQAMMVDRAYGSAGERVVIEECLRGREASFFVLTDGTNVLPFHSAEDHKRVFDGDAGPNTGGMGAFSPSPAFDEALEKRVLETIVRPVVDGLREEGREFRGFLYAGLMITAEGPKVLEFNARLGDPEAQAVLPLFDGELLPLLAQVASGRLEERRCAFRDGAAVGVVLASRGYPERPETGFVVNGLREASAFPDVLVFHAGTVLRGGHVVTAGGRVLTIVGLGRNHRSAMERAYEAASLVSFEGLHKRTDIGRKAIGG
ncbi:MAG: phosphoribosylamine--glycine ligase [Vicinamibacterales bacterium]